MQVPYLCGAVGHFSFHAWVVSDVVIFLWSLFQVGVIQGRINDDDMTEWGVGILGELKQ